jgi:hypothetical protein
MAPAGKGEVTLSEVVGLVVGLLGTATPALLRHMMALCWSVLPLCAAHWLGKRRKGAGPESRLDKVCGLVFGQQ